MSLAGAVQDKLNVVFPSPVAVNPVGAAGVVTVPVVAYTSSERWLRAYDVDSLFTINP